MLEYPRYSVGALVQFKHDEFDGYTWKTQSYVGIVSEGYQPFITVMTTAGKSLTIYAGFATPVELPEKTKD